MTRKERIMEELKHRIIANNYKKFTITMKCNGDCLELTPMSQAYELNKIEDVEWVIVRGSEYPWMGGTIETVAENLDKYEELLNGRFADISKLKAHIRKYGCMDGEYLSSWVSDYHKDIFGRRPHCSESQLIAWANSDSTEPAIG